MTEQRPLLSAEDVERVRRAAGWVKETGSSLIFGDEDTPALLDDLADRLEEILKLFTAEHLVALRDALECSGTVTSPDNLPLATEAADRLSRLVQEKP